MDSLSHVEIGRFQVEHIPHIRSRLGLSQFKRSRSLPAQNIKSAPSFKRCQQIQIENNAGSRISQSRQRNRCRLSINNTFNFSVNIKQNIRRRQINLFYFVGATLANITRKRILGLNKSIRGIQLNHLTLSALRKFVQGNNTRNSSVYKHIDNIQILFRRINLFQRARRRNFFLGAA